MNSGSNRIVIVGGGMVGAAAACGLADLDTEVVVVEQRQPDFDWPADTIDLRVSAINRASRYLLENLGAWQHVTPAYPYRDMRVWDSPSTEIHFDSASIGEPDLGHIVQNRVIQRALWKAMEQRPRIRIMTPTTLSAIEQHASAVELAFEDGTSLETDLLVAADGARSAVRDMLRIDVTEHDFHQYAVVANITLQDGHAETAWQRFLPAGPLAFLPVAKDQCSIVWSTTESEADALLAMDDASFCDALADAVDHRLGPIVATSRRAHFPLRSMHATHYAAQNAVLVGDAAHQIHPLAGQGVNLGFRDAGTLVDVIRDAIDRKRPVGAMQILRNYERSRRGDNLLMQKSMEGFNRLFSNTNTPLRLLRNSGLAIADKSSVIKQAFMQHALGTSGDLPELCRFHGPAEMPSRIG